MKPTYTRAPVSALLGRVIDMDENKPWDIKTIKVSLGGEDDVNGFVVFQIFEYREGAKLIIKSNDDEDCFFGEIPMDAAIRLRDFLNYAVPNAELTGRGLES